eukprot:3649868-Rhodomonas_salina.1
MPCAKLVSQVLLPTVLRAPYDVSGTDMVYAATFPATCLVLTWPMPLSLLTSAFPMTCPALIRRMPVPGNTK